MSHDDSDNEESKKPTKLVFIDEEEPHVNTETDQSEITSTTVDETSECLIGDHDYVGPRTGSRTNSNSRFFGDNNEPFPVLEGLEFYIGDEDQNDFNNTSLLKQGYEQRKNRNVDQHNRVTSSVPTVINTNVYGSYPRVHTVRTVLRSDNYSPSPIGGTVRRRMVNQSNLPTVFNQRRTTPQNEYNSVRGTGGRMLEPIGYRYTSTVGTPTNRNSGNYGNAAVISNDTTRATNDVTSASLIIPSRGSKTIQRGRLTSSNRGVTQQHAGSINIGANYSPSRKVYQVSRGYNEYIPPPNDVHNYVKAPVDYEQSIRKSQSQQHFDDNNQSSTNSNNHSSATIIDVVEEEEAQNAKFFQNQYQSMGILSLRDKQSRRLSESVQMQLDNQHQMNVKIDELDVSQQQIGQQRSPINSHCRTIDSNVQPHSVPTILQRGHRHQLGQISMEYDSGIEQHQSQHYVEQPYNSESIIASKQAQRPRGRPRGSSQRHSMSSSINIHHHSFPIRQQRHEQQATNVDIGITSSTSQYVNSSSNTSIDLISSQKATPTSMQEHQKDVSSKPNTQQNSMQQSKSSTYVYQQQRSEINAEEKNIEVGISKYYQHPQQFQQQNSFLNENENTTMLQQHQRQDEVRQQPNHQKPHYQSLEDLAELAQLSQQQNFAPSTQRPMYQIPSGSSPSKQTRQFMDLKQNGHSDGQQLPNQSQYFSLNSKNIQSMTNYTTYAAYGKTTDQINTSFLDENNQPQENHTEISKKFKKIKIAKQSKFEKEKKKAFLKEFNKKEINEKCLRRSKKPFLKEKTQEAEWEGQDYTTRCLCDMSHNDEFMIACERCDVWQHAICMGISKNNIPDAYFCELCQPRSLKNTKQQAILIQQKKLPKLIDFNSKLKRKKQKLNFKVKKLSKPNLTIVQEKKLVNDSKCFIETLENTYSRSVKLFLQQTQYVGNPGLLDLLKGEEVARQMFVASNVEGLVATREIKSGTPIIEYTGSFSFINESPSNEKKIAKKNFILRYTGFGEENIILIDASKIGSAARFARRSCKPNAIIDHAICDEKLHVFFVAAEMIDFSAEITIPFDYDYTTSQTPINCACGIVDNRFSIDCKIRKFNQSLVMTKESEKIIESKDKMVVNGRRRSRLNSNDSETKIKSVSPLRKKVSPKLQIRRSERFKKSSEDIKLELEKEEIKENSNKSCFLDKKKSPFNDFKLQDNKKEKLNDEKKLTKSKEEQSLLNEAKNIEKEKKNELIDISSTKIRRSAQISLSNNDNKISEKEKRNLRKVNRNDKIDDLDEKEQFDEDLLNGKEETNDLKRKVTKLLQPELESNSATRRTRSSAKEEEKFGVMSVDKKEICNENLPSSSIKLSREERKLQETLAAFERLEKREKQKKQRKSIEHCLNETSDKRTLYASVSSTPTKDVKSKNFNLQQQSLPEKKRSSRLLSLSSYTPVTSSSSELPKKVVLTEPKKETETTTTKLFKRNINNDVENVFKKKEVEKQLSHVEAARLLTEMASGLKSIDNEKLLEEDKLNHNIRSQLILIAKCALEKCNMKSSFKKVAEQDQHYVLKNEFRSSSSLSPRRLQKQIFEKKVQKEVENLSDSNKISQTRLDEDLKLNESADFLSKNNTELVPNTKLVKKLTLDEYRKRRNTVVGNDLDDNVKQQKMSPSKHSKTPSFMPSLKNLKDVGSAVLSPEKPLSPRSAILDISIGNRLSSPTSCSTSSFLPTTASKGTTLNSNETAPSIDELRRRIYGGKIGSTVKDNVSNDNLNQISGSNNDLATKTSNAITNNSKQSSITLQPRLSLEERLQKQFGLGRTGTNTNFSQSAVVDSNRSSSSSSTGSNIDNNSPITRSQTANASMQNTCGEITRVLRQPESNASFNSSVIVPPPPPPPILNTQSQRR